MADERLGINVVTSGTGKAADELKDIGTAAKETEKDLTDLQRTMQNMQLTAPMKAVVENFKSAIAQIQDSDPRKMFDAWKQANDSLKDITGADLIKNSWESLANATTPQEIMDAMKNIGSEFKRKANIADAAEKQTQQALRETLRQMKEVEKQSTKSQQSLQTETKKTNGLFTNFYGSLIRIAKLRMLRGIIRMITQAFKEGTQNIYQYSQALGSADASHFASTMNELASSLLYIKNSIGAVIAPLLSGLLPAIQTIVNWFALACDLIAQFFAILNGQATYTRAKRQATAWQGVATAAGGAAAAAKEYENTILSFDEIHALNDIPESGGGGGGGGAGVPDYGSMFEEAAIADNLFTRIAKGVKPIFKTVTGAVQGMMDLVVPMMDLIDGWITNQPDKVQKALKEVQEVFKNNEVLQQIADFIFGIDPSKWWKTPIGVFIDYIKWKVLDLVEWLKDNVPWVLEFLGFNIDELGDKITRNRYDLERHAQEIVNSNISMVMWTKGIDNVKPVLDGFTNGLYDAKYGAMGFDKTMNSTTKDTDAFTVATTEAGKEIKATKGTVGTARGEWGAYSTAVYNAQVETIGTKTAAQQLGNTNINTSGITNGIWGIYNAADYAKTRIWDIIYAIQTLGQQSIKGLNIGIQAAFYKNGGFVGKMENGGIIPRYDYGGINSAQLFLANENGNAELIGSIGNRTAVANQGEMVDAMAQGVYRAMSEVMSQGSSNTEVVVQMDGETVARAVDRGNRSLNRRFKVGLA